MSLKHLRRVLVVLFVLAAGTALPIQPAWSEPAVRLDELPAAPGAVVDLTYPSSHLGVRWHGDEGDVLDLRWRASASPWSAWQPVTLAHDLGDDATGVRLSGLIVTDDAVDAQVRVRSGSPAGDRSGGHRHRARPAPRHRRPPAGGGRAERPARAGDDDHDDGRRAGRRAGLLPSSPPPVPQPNVITRSQWGADESMKGSDPAAFAPIRRLALHHTAGGEGDDPAATVRAIYAYHTKSNGWNDIGYNFLVDSAGRIYEGRYARQYVNGEMPTGEDTGRRGVIGAHISGNNTGTVGVALLGDFSGDNRPTSRGRGRRRADVRLEGRPPRHRRDRHRHMVDRRQAGADRPPRRRHDGVPRRSPLRAAAGHAPAHRRPPSARSSRGPPPPATGC